MQVFAEALLVTVLGLVFGSFANVVIYRLPRGESLSVPASHCPGCGEPIRFYDNVPVLGWLMLRGRCRDCAEPIALKYPMVELASGLLWLLAYVLYGLSFRLPFAIVFYYVLLLLAAIDLDTFRLPNVLVGGLAVVGLAGAVLAQASGLPVVPLIGANPVLGSPLLAAALGTMLAASLTLAISVAYRAVRHSDGLGMGDVKLLGAMGLFLGPYSILALFLGSLLGAVYGVGASVTKGSDLRVKIPFGPFLAVAGVAITVFGEALWTWYSGLLGA